MRTILADRPARRLERIGLKSRRHRAINQTVESPSFTFRLERVRTIREHAEGAARDELARELSHRVRGEALLREAAHTVSSETLALGPGPIITLDGLAGEPVDLLVSGKPIARGEVVVIDEELGPRVTEVVTGTRAGDAGTA